MQNWIPKWTLVLACCASSALAAGTATMQFADVGAGGIMGGVYTSPYGISVDGTKMSLICDDFLTDVSFNTWTANITTLTDLQTRVGAPASNPQTPKFTSGGSPGVITNGDVSKYAAAAYLAAELMSLSPSDLAGAKGGEYSFAIWGVFDTGLLGTPQSNPYGSLTDPQLQAAISFRDGAFSFVNSISNGGIVDLSRLAYGGNTISLTIYTPTGPSNPGLNSSQEFLQVSMPEPSFPAILAVDLLAVVGLMVVFRRRISGMVN